jgi:hypothetical protein
LKRAYDWTKTRLTQYGLVKAAIEPWGDFGRGWDIEKSYVAMTTPYYHTMLGAPRAWTPSTSGALRKQVVYVKATTEADLDKFKGQLRDKIVVTEVATPPKEGFEPDAKRYTDEELTKMAAGPAAPAGAPAPASDADRMATYRARLALRTKMNDMLMSEGAAAVLSTRGGSQGTFF